MALVSHLSHENKFILLGVYITEKVDLFPLACVLLDRCEPYSKKVQNDSSIFAYLIYVPSVIVRRNVPSGCPTRKFIRLVFSSKENETIVVIYSCTYGKPTLQPSGPVTRRFCSGVRILQRLSEKSKMPRCVTKTVERGSQTSKLHR
jgi:hypothetical protein